MAMTTTVMRMTMTSGDGTGTGTVITGPGTVITGPRITKRRESYTIRYSSGWRNTEQDRKPAPRVAGIINQDYNAIKQECLAKDELWEDPAFPATDQSIYPSSQGPLPFTWMRASVSVR